jgi:hypothetical protein
MKVPGTIYVKRPVTKEIQLVYVENVGYGFRRNLWGIKPYGIGFCVMAIANRSSL